MGIIRRILRRRRNELRIAMKGKIRLELYGEDGNLKTCVEKENLIVDAGLEWIKSYCFDAATPYVQMAQIAIGTGVNPVAPADVALQTESVRQAIATYTPGGTGVMTIDTTFAAGVGTGIITEAGVFELPVAGQMWNRVVFAAVNKTAGDTLKVAVTVTFTAV